MKRLFTGVIAFAMVLTIAGSVSASKAKAATIADLQAMIAQLTAQLSAMSGGSTSGATFSVDLTMGSKGADVTALQNLLIGKGFSIPAGATGYFGGQTKAAVSAWQASAGISPAAGYFGPKSRGAVNAMASTGGTTPVVPTPVGTTVPVGISTPGVEGVLTVDLNPTPGSGLTLRENDQMASYIGIRIRPQNSDVVVQRVKVDLGTNSNVYTKVFRKIYLMDGSTVVASQDLTTSTVTRESGSPDRFVITLTGFQFLVAKDATKVLTVAFDLYSSISAANVSTFSGIPVIIPKDGVRATDGAGLDQYGPAAINGFNLQQTLSTSLVDSAQLQLSTDSNTPKAAEIVAADGTANNEKDKVALLTASLYAQKDNTVVRTWAVRVQKTGTGTATMPTVWLMDGSTAVGSAAVTYSGVTGTATFNNLTLSIPKDTTKSFTIAVDVRSANGTATTLAASTTASDIAAENSLGSTITAGTNLTGSATGQSIVARNIGPVFTLTGRNPVKGATPVNGNNSTSTMSSTFTLNVQAVGGDILFGAAGSSTAMFATSSSFTVYQNGSAVILLVASSTAYDTPSSGVVTSNNSFTLQRNNSISIPVTFLFEGRTAAGVAVTSGSYAVGINSIAWVSSNGSSSSTFMAGNTDWRTSTVSLP